MFVSVKIYQMCKNCHRTSYFVVRTHVIISSSVQGENDGQLTTNYHDSGHITMENH